MALDTIGRSECVASQLRKASVSGSGRMSLKKADESR
jgi:hypothetical protein